MLASVAIAATLPGRDRPSPRARCYDVLIAALKDDSQWVRAHAAEALVQSNRPDPALDAFRPLADTAEPKYRVVVWRILAQAEPEAADRRRYIERIRTALLDRDGPDQTHAMEALAKLHEPAADDGERALVRDIADGGGPMSPFAVWRLAQANDPASVERLVKLLRSHDAVTRARAAYVLGRLAPLPQTVTVAIADVLKSERPDSPAHAMLRTAHGPDGAREVAKDIKGLPSGRYLAGMYLAERGTVDDVAMLGQLLDAADPDVRVAGAFALLMIDGRTQPATKAGKS